MVKIRSVQSWSQHNFLDISSDPKALDYLRSGVYNEASFYRTVTLLYQDCMLLVNIYDSETRCTMIEIELNHKINLSMYINLFNVNSCAIFSFTKCCRLNPDSHQNIYCECYVSMFNVISCVIYTFTKCEQLNPH